MPSISARSVRGRSSKARAALKSVLKLFADPVRKAGKSAMDRVALLGLGW